MYKREERQRQRQRQRQQTKQTTNFLVSIVVFVRESYLFVFRLNVELWRVGVNNIMYIVKYEYDKYFKL